VSQRQIKYLNDEAEIEAARNRFSENNDPENLAGRTGRGVRVQSGDKVRKTFFSSSLMEEQ
jgi:hypothetical protein